MCDLWMKHHDDDDDGDDDDDDDDDDDKNDLDHVHADKMTTNDGG